jgi:transcriptional regulator GlxA family with amidase domain
MKTTQFSFYGRNCTICATGVQDRNDMTWPSKADVLPPIRSVGFLLVPGFALMTYASAIEPLRAANQLAGRTLYRWWHAAPEDKPALASNGVAVLPDCKFGSDPDDLDLMIVCAGGNPTTFNDKRTFGWLRRLARRGTIIGGL